MTSRERTDDPRQRVTVFNRAEWERTAPAYLVEEARLIPDTAMALHLEECRVRDLDPHGGAGLVVCERCGAQVTYPIDDPAPPPPPHLTSCPRYVGPVGTLDVVVGDAHSIRVCRGCGAVVHDVDLHERFHARLRANAV